ncbi:MAG: hypothetical protein JSS14_23035 [Proteobacteria bacterium]|nr:hypothetical protein [Pseudomonadota bacterium]
MSRIWIVSLALPVLMGAAPAWGAEAPSPPTLEESQGAYARHAAQVLSRLVKDGKPVQLTNEQLASINEFARRRTLRGCDDWRVPERDAFAPADAPPPPVVFNCTWDSGERISLTYVPNTRSWTMSDDRTAAAAAAMLLTGPQQPEEKKVVAVPVAPVKPAAQESAAQVPQVAASAAAPIASALLGASMIAMPSPFVPPARAETVRPSATPASVAGPMPTPFSNASK